VILLICRNIMDSHMHESIYISLSFQHCYKTINYVKLAIAEVIINVCNIFFVFV